MLLLILPLQLLLVWLLCILLLLLLWPLVLLLLPASHCSYRKYPNFYTPHFNTPSPAPDVNYVVTLVFFAICNFQSIPGIIGGIQMIQESRKPTISNSGLSGEKSVGRVDTCTYCKLSTVLKAGRYCKICNKIMIVGGPQSLPVYSGIAGYYTTTHRWYAQSAMALRFGHL